jgi:hypothetical protein
MEEMKERAILERRDSRSSMESQFWETINFCKVKNSFGLDHQTKQDKRIKALVLNFHSQFELCV